MNFSRQSWPYNSESDVATDSTSKSKAFARWHLTDEILTLFYLRFPTFAIWSHPSLTSCAVFFMELGHVLWTDWQIGSRPNETSLENAAGCNLCEKISRWQIGLTDAGQLHENLLLRINFSASTSRQSWLVSPRVIFHLSLVPLLVARHDLLLTDRF